MNTTKQIGFGSALVAMMFLGCGKNQDPAVDGLGNAHISVSAQALTVADVATVKVTVSGAHISPDIVRALDGSPTTGWSGTITDIPAGSDRKFAAEALDAARVALYSGSTRGVTIANGRTAMVSIFLQQVAKPDPFANTVPRITSLVISDETIAPGQTITLTVTAVDPDFGDTLSYAWRASDGTLGNDRAATTTWTAPSTAGVYELVASATDRAGATATVKAKLDVREHHGSGSALVNATLNTWPVVVGLVPNPTRINVGETTKLDLTASDPDGDPLTYAWNSNCETAPRTPTLPVVYGVFDDASAEDPSFTLNRLPTSGQCTLIATITDGRGGTNTAKVTIETGPGIGNTPNCTDSLRNGTETDVDCGGPSCPSCADGKLCAAASDCLSGVCTDGLCMAPSCRDGVKNGTETDQDCGGPGCSPCADGDSCAAATDCRSGVCTGGICIAATCTDGIENGTETDVDCGGSSCLPCANGDSCAAATDCQSGVCTGGLCAIPRCGDGVVQGRESCDDGNTNNDDSCHNDCTRPAVTALAVGVYHNCALFDNGQVKCWGYNVAGQLGLGDTLDRGDLPGEMGDNLPVVDLGTGRKVTAISAGADHTCAILDNGSAKCWGWGGVGQLGLGDTLNRGDQPGEMGDSLPVVSLGLGRTVVAISGTTFHTCVILDNGSVKCWGSNSNGQLGLGDTTSRGDQPGEMGDSLPTVDLGSGRTARGISTGRTHTCAVLDNGMVKCWGVNRYGELGLGDTASRGDQPGEMGDSLPAVNLGTGRTATAISGSADHTCAMLDNGSVKCWGYNADGELGQGLSDYVLGDEPGEMGDSLLAVSLGTGRTVISISGGRVLTCAVLDNGMVKCWGCNNYGVLGLGDTLDRGGQPGEMGDNLPAVDFGVGETAIAVIGGGGDHACALLNDRSVKCWGYNWGGALGVGDSLDRGDEPGEMGDNLPTVQLWGP